MYYLIIVLLMFVCPTASVLTELLVFKSSAGLIFLIGKWFVFWVVGVRLFLAGLRQSSNPRFTAEQIFGIKNTEALVVVQELGFANVSLGILGLITIFQSVWVLPAAIAGGLFYGLAGLKHITMKARNHMENTALLSDLFAFLVFLIYCIGTLVR